MRDTPAAEPLFRRLESQLRSSIMSGEMPLGARLPPETELCSRYSVSRATLRKALDGLKGEGLVTRTRKRGTFVSEELRFPRARPVVGVVAPDRESGLIGTVVEAAEVALGARGIDVRFYPSGNDAGETERMLAQARADGVAGILLYPAYETLYSDETEGLVAAGFPLCLFDRALRHLATDCVSTDNLAAGRMAASHMIGLGHQRIAFLTRASSATESVYSRFEGFRGALLRAGLWEGSCHLTLGLGGGGDHADELASLLESAAAPTAIVAINESVAMDAVKLVLASGRRVPSDVAVIAFGSPDMGHRFMVPLTLVEQPFSLMGTLAAQTLMERIAGTAVGICWRMLPPKLVVRESCGG